MVVVIFFEYFEFVVNKMEFCIVVNIFSCFDIVFSDIFKQMQEIQKRCDVEFVNSQFYLLQMVFDVFNDNIEFVFCVLIIEQIDKNVIFFICGFVDCFVVEQLSSQISFQVNVV